MGALLSFCRLYTRLFAQPSDILPCFLSKRVIRMARDEELERLPRAFCFEAPVFGLDDDFRVRRRNHRTTRSFGPVACGRQHKTGRSYHGYL